MDRLLAWMPGVRSMAEHPRLFFVRDVPAGLVLAAFAVPVSMAYASLAGLEPIHGLYASMASLVAYALFGPSRHLIVGPDSSTAPLVAAVVVPLALSDPAERLALAGLLSLVVGAVLVLIGIVRLGFVTDLVAKPARIGFLNGVALTIVVSQLPRLLGLSVTGSDVASTVLETAAALRNVVPLALAFGAGALAVSLIAHLVAPRAPGMLVAVVASTVLSALTDAGARGVETVGAMPAGLPALQLPRLAVDQVGAVVAGAVSIAIVTLADGAVLSQSLADRTRASRPSPDEEAVALGVANLASGLFHGFPVSASMTRSAVNVGAGAVSQASGLVAAVFIGLMLVAAPGLLADLPVPVLAAVAIVAAVQLANIAGMMRLFRLRRTEFALAVASFVAVLALGVLSGVLVAVALSLLNFVRRQWRPHDAVLGRVPGVKGYHDTADFPEAREVPGLMLYRFDAPLFFANARVFQERLRTRLSERPESPRRVVFAAEPMTDVDTTAADVLAETIRSLQEAGIEVGFAELKHPVRERLERYGIIDLVGEHMLFPTIGSAVHDHVARSGVAWVDWEEQERSGSPGAGAEAPGPDDGASGHTSR
ncbi:MAG: sulfate permease [Coriobacteriia bacterium]|nr:sulfate permease [Coriobacteriia bacterium]